MDQARTTLPSLKSSSDKYDVLYVNTPWSKLDTTTIGKVPLQLDPQIRKQSHQVTCHIWQYELDLDPVVALGHQMGMHQCNYW